MRLTMPMCCATKCCGCIVLSQLTGVVLSFGALGLFLGLFYWYILPWGQSQIVQSLHLPKGTSYDSISDATLNAQKCNGCVLGRNTQWPTTTTGTLHFLDTTAGTLISSTVATSLVAAASVGAGSMLWAALFPTMASILSFSSGFYEMTHIIEMAQYISIIGQLRLKGAPEFLDQFSKTMAWTNFNIPKSITGAILPIGKRRLSSTGFSAVEPKFGGNSGPAKYAKAIGVEPKYLFFYTLGIFGLVLVLFHLLFVIWIFLMAAISKRQSFSEIGATWYRKVVWAIILALLLAQYIFAMTGSYYLYENVRFSETDSNFIIGCIILVALIGCTALFGIIIISRNKQELKDLGTYEHEQRPFATKYSAYYDEYNYDNRYFFVPRILLAISTGIIVGIVQEPTSQILCILSLTMMYLALLIIREPNLLRFLYYVGIASVFMKVVLHCLLLLLVHDDVFPQEVRNKASYAIIGINIFIFFLLFIRQAYLIVYKIVQACKHKDEGHEEIEMDARGQRMDRNQIQTPGYDGVSGQYERLGSQGPYDQVTVEQQKLYGKNPSAYEADRLGTMGGQPHRPQVRWSDQSQPVNGPTSPMGSMSGGVMYSRTLRPSRNEGVAETGVVPQELASNAKPQPTWRRNIERRAQEAAAAAAVDTKPLESLRESNDTTSSYDLEPGGTTQIPVSTTQRSSTTSSQDWFQQRMSSIESEMTQTFSSSALEFRDSGTSFITDHPGLAASKNPSITPLPENDSIRSLSQSPHGINRVETSEIDRVADGYLHQKPLRAVERSMQGDVDIDALDSGSERGSSLCRPSSIDIDQNSDEEGSRGTDPDEERETSRLSLLPTRNARGVVNDSFVSAMSYEETR